MEWDKDQVLVFAIIVALVFVSAVYVSQIGREWVEVSFPFSQYGEPWGDDDNIVRFFKFKGIQVHDIRITNIAPSCEECGFERIEILIDGKDRDDLNRILEGYRS
jgi:hypothetical protein